LKEENDECNDESSLYLERTIFSQSNALHIFVYEESLYSLLYFLPIIFFLLKYLVEDYYNLLKYKKLLNLYYMNNEIEKESQIII